MSIARTSGPARVRPRIRQILFPLKEILAPPPDANRPQRDEHCGRGVFRQDGPERRIELRETFPRQNLRDPAPKLRREKQRVNADRRPGGRERQVMGRGRAKDAVRSALDLVLCALRASPPESAAAPRRTKGRRPRETERGHRADSHRRRGRARALRRMRTYRSRNPNTRDREDEKRRQRRQKKARPPPRLPVPRPPCGRSEKKRKSRGGAGERQRRITPAEREEAERREQDDRRVPEQTLVREHRQPEEPREEGIRERLPRIPSEELSEARQFEESPEKENSREGKEQRPRHRRTARTFARVGTPPAPLPF